MANSCFHPFKAQHTDITFSPEDDGCQLIRSIAVDMLYMLLMCRSNGVFQWGRISGLQVEKRFVNPEDATNMAAYTAKAY